MISKELAYWVGVAQSDGHFKKYKEKRKGKLIDRAKMVLGIKEKSLPMLEKFRKLSQTIFKTSGHRYIDKRNTIIYEIRVKKFLEKFKELEIDFSDPPKPPKWCLKNQKLFGAYLAGIIDGDGDVRIGRKKYPFCAVRITSGKEQKELRTNIKEILNCGCNHNFRQQKSIIEGRKIEGSWHIVEFYISSKNYKFAEEHLLPEISIPHKRERIVNFIESRIKKQKGGNRESNSNFTDHNRAY